MGEPSEYELAAWRDIQQFTGRPVSRQMRAAGEHVAQKVADVGQYAGRYLESHPKAGSALSRGQEVAAKGGRLLGGGARKAVDALPDWAGTARHAARKTGARISRVGLSPAKVVDAHKRRGHDVERLADVRVLDLEQVDAVRGRAASWYYPAAAALSGAGAGVVITGGQVFTAASAGAAAAPSGAAIAGAMAGDATAVLALASRSVGHVALHYGYDPDDPAERLFIMSVVNAGSAMSAGAKTAAMADLSRLTQALVRGKSWAVLNDAVLAKVAQQFAKAFGFRLTKQGLGKAVPAAGVFVGGALNWATLEAIVDAADVAYRRRFLLAKYPQLEHEQTFQTSDVDVGTAGDVEPVHGEPEPGQDASVAESTPGEQPATDTEFSVLDELREAGGPDLT
ncbi:EcsC family protein [Terracoccus luteus]|uniref:EcsC family protein n=1 Tax=Terracoccus luteus TaxID=53356 RepID=A0A839Q4M6_9MICO|nr:EcsC family protein [Terracoccus luteus]MBB2988122.1 hypothetical protein [Terracoccus luteus]MCP2174138.1 hypothetical protein [Terracoccus luteus]